MSEYVLVGRVCFLSLHLLMFPGETSKKLLAAVISNGVLKLAGTVGGSCFSIAILILRRGIRGEGIVIYSGKEEAVAVVSELATAAVLLYLLRPLLSSVLEKKSKNWYVMLAVPLMFLTVLTDIVTWGATKGIMFRGADRWNLSYNQLFSHGANLALALLCMCAGGGYMFGMDRIYREQKRGEQYRSQVAVYKMMEEQYRQMERLRHDMKNHVTGLQGLLEHREWEKMKDYLERMAEAGAFCKSEEATGNKVVDALLYQKFITIQSGVRNSFFLLEARNSINPEPVKGAAKDGKTGKKADGTGLSNMREAAGKYNGTVRTEPGYSVFTVSVLLPLPESYMTSEKPFDTES
ncbi:GHKL domain-containing protein [Lachnospiraceae bacterium KK002]